MQLNVHYHSHKSAPPPLVPIVSRIPPYYTSSRFILTYSSNLCQWPSGLPTKILYAPLLSSIRAACYTYLIILDLTTQMILVKSEDRKYYELHLYIVFSSPLLTCSS
jgi:hypothetical protein